MKAPPNPKPIRFLLTIHPSIPLSPEEKEALRLTLLKTLQFHEGFMGLLEDEKEILQFQISEFDLKP